MEILLIYSVTSNEFIVMEFIYMPILLVILMHLSTGAGTTGQTVAAVPSGLSFTSREK
jgi:hypothetical protein